MSPYRYQILTISQDNLIKKNKKKEAKDKEQHSSKAMNSSRQICTDVIRDNKTIIHDGDTIKTRSGHISKTQTDWQTNSY